LIEFAKRVAQLSTGHAWENALGSIGLYLHPELKNGGYYCTPINSVAFASTGGNGVHFSFLEHEDFVRDNAPVLMTVPLAHVENVIVGSNLREFLSLGCDTDYFILEQLAYNDPKGRSAFLTSYPDGYAQGKTARDQLQMLRGELQLFSWTDVETRLTELQAQFLPLLRFTER